MRLPSNSPTECLALPKASPSLASFVVDLNFLRSVAAHVEAISNTSPDLARHHIAGVASSVAAAGLEVADNPNDFEIRVMRRGRSKIGLVENA